MHSEKCEGSQDSFLRFWAAVGVVGALLLKITAEKASMNRKFPFTVHRRVGTFLLSGKASFACTRKDFNPVGHPAVCSVHFTRALYEKGTRKYLKPEGQFQPSGRKTSAIISERDHRMVGEYLFAVCDNITCMVRYTFPHIPKRYFAQLSCVYTCIHPNRFRLNCIICAPSHELFSVSPPSRLRDTQKLFLFNLATWYAVSRK